MAGPIAFRMAAASSGMKALGISPKKLQLSSIPNRSKKRVRLGGKSSPMKVDLPRVMTVDEVLTVHGVDRFAGFDAMPHLVERMESFVAKQADFELDYAYLISNSGPDMRLRTRRRVWCDHIAHTLLEDFRVDNAQECIEVAIWLIDAYICKKRPDRIVNKTLIDLVVTVIPMVTKVHNISYICFKEMMSHTENTMTQKDAKNLEADILLELDWKLFPPTVPTAIEHLAALLGCPDAFTDEAKKIWNMCRSTLDTIKFTPAVLAAAALMGRATKQPQYVKYVYDMHEAAHFCHSTAQAVQLANNMLLRIEAEELKRRAAEEAKKKKEEEEDAATQQKGKKRKAPTVECTA